MFLLRHYHSIFTRKSLSYFLLESMIIFTETIYLYLKNTPTYMVCKSNICRIFIEFKEKFLHEFYVILSTLFSVKKVWKRFINKLILSVSSDIDLYT